MAAPGSYLMKSLCPFQVDESSPDEKRSFRINQLFEDGHGKSESKNELINKYFLS